MTAERSRQPRARAVTVVLAVVAILAGCVMLAACATPPAPPSAATATPEAVVIASLSPSPTPSPQPAPATTVPPTSTPEPLPASWATVDPMPEGLDAPRAVKLVDGRVFVVGQRSRQPKNDVARPTATAALLWDPTTGKWHRVQGLDELRTDYTLVALTDGRALLIGGIDADGKALAMTLAFDPAAERWSKAGRLAMPRAASAATVLADGRVLVAGGYTALKETWGDTNAAPAVRLAAYRPSEPSTAPHAPLFDMIPATKVKALATAEIYDPKSGAWSSTGAMRYARSGAAATTLDDGRGLVVGSAVDAAFPIWPDERAVTTAELYDPATGRFAPAGKLPPIADAPGIDRDTLRSWPVRMGTLVAMPGSDAGLIGQMSFSYNTNGMTRSFRFDADTSTWSELGESWIRVGTADDKLTHVADGPDIGGAAVVPLSDGRVLVAGGGASQNQMDSPLLATARIYDPVTDRWMKGPKLPKARTMTTAVRLDDGSVLMFGGYAKRYWWDSPPLRSVIRFLPER